MQACVHQRKLFYMKKMNYLICFKIRKSSCVLYKVGLMRFKVTPQKVAIIFFLLKSKFFLNHSAHITPLLHDLHWLPVASRIHFKKLLLTFKALNGLAPPHLSDILHSYSLPRYLRSSELGLFSIPRYRLSTVVGHLVLMLLNYGIRQNPHSS